MPEGKKGGLPVETHWAIKPDWFQLNQRSATVLVKDYLCPACAKRLNDKKTELKELLATIQSCCSHTPDFLNDKLPVMESAFRLFLSNGNRPLTLKEITSELAKVRYGDIYRASPEILLRILRNDCFYGIQEVTS
jgi:hypothetical protein